MKRISRTLSFLFLGLILLVSTACQTSSKPKKKVPVPPSAGQDVSGLSWNRPRSFESSAGLGGAMPQSR